MVQVDILEQPPARHGFPCAASFSVGLWLRIPKMSEALGEPSRAPSRANKHNGYLYTHTNDNSTSQKGGQLPLIAN